MESRLLGKDDRPKAEALWKEAFGDSDAFITWYFDNKVESSLGLFEGDALVSVLHLIPYTISVQSVPLPTAFIAGAATAEQKRGQGLMRRLLHETLELLKSRGILMTHLYPESHAFYEKFGWAAYTHVNRQTVTAAPYRRSADIVQTRDSYSLGTLYARMMRGFDGYVIRSEREWRWRLDELAIDGGHSAVLLENGSARAYMLYYGEGDKARVIETVYTAEEDIGALLGFVCAQGYKSAVYTIPDKNGEKFGMARIVDVKALLAALGAKELLEHTDIKDDFAAWNNTDSGRGKSVDIASLAALIHQGTDLKTAEVLGHYFVMRNTCIFETY